MIARSKSAALLLFAAILAGAPSASYSKERNQKPSERFSVSKLPTPNSWEKEGDASVSLDFSGSSAVLALSGPGELSTKLPNQSKNKITFVTFALQACAGENLEGSTTVTIGGTKIGFRHYDAPEDPEGGGIAAPVEIMVRDGLAEEGEEWMSANVFISAKPEAPHMMSGAPKLTIRIDESGPVPVWDFYLGERLMLANLGLLDDKQSKRLAVRIGQHSSVLLKEFAVSRENPLFEDVNVNGIPDAYETELLGGLIEDAGGRSVPIDGGPSLLESYLGVYPSRQVGGEGEV